MQAAAAVAAAVFVVACLGLLPPAAAHQFKYGKCKKANSMANFDPSRFNGTWFVHRKLTTKSKCMMVTYDWNEDKKVFDVQEGRLPPTSDMVPSPFDFYLTNVGDLTQIDSKNPAVMKLVWEGSGFVADLLPYSLTVVDTDYDNYALNVECQSLMGIAKRVSASVLTRFQTPSTEAKMDEYLTKLAAEPDVDLSKMNFIKQKGCASPDDSTYNIRYNEQGISLMGLSGNEEVRKLTTATGVKEYVDKTLENEEKKQNEESP